ncbi:MAG TPA: hypothetical protein VFI38_14990 [Candidatus Acidoferrum sp.]|nr:hypothetical protein [Candidatus Acidoferrum sp.]
MRYLLQFLNRWRGGRNRNNDATWTRKTPWRQGSVLPLECAVKLGLIDKEKSSKEIAIVVSHDCDLASEIEDEPDVEIIIGTSIVACLPDKTHAKNVRSLHIQTSGQSGQAAWEFLARHKVSVSKSKLVRYLPDGTQSLGIDALDTLRSWLAARYKRASIPDGLQSLIKDIFQEVAKKKERPHALRGIWIDFEPDADKLPEGEKYELWVTVVYSTSVEGSREIAEEVAKQVESKFRKKYYRGGRWVELDLRRCVARSDTEFTLNDVHQNKLFRLEYLSLRTGAPLESEE